jgi:mannose-6-phosphate isomerase-like protein (cupin superfamily)
MTNLERLERKDIGKVEIYRNPDEPDGETWIPIFCYSSLLPPVSYVQRHKHPKMKEGFCVEEGALLLVDESPEGETVEIELNQGDYYLVQEGHWHTLVNSGDIKVSFLAMGLIKELGGVTIDQEK